MTLCMKILLNLILAFLCCATIPAHAVSYGVVRAAAPVLNTPEFSKIFGGSDGVTLQADRCGQVRELEFIALPGTIFTIRGDISDGRNTIFSVETDDYPQSPGVELFLDSRFVELHQQIPAPRRRRLPSRVDIQTSLKAAIGSPYVWGGNVQGGVRELIDLYYGGQIPDPAGKRLILAGLDCSGLLYQATDGWTPRNTSQLVSFGKDVKISGLSVREISAVLEPLDLIVWNGHVLIVLDRGTIIESRLQCGNAKNGGVVVTSLQKRLTEIMRTRRPADRWPTSGKQRDVFVVRRWY